MPNRPKFRQPRYLFKYAKIDQYLPSILLDAKLYLSSCLRFNDPFDCRFKVSTDCSFEDFKKWLRFRSNRGIFEALKRKYPLKSGNPLYKLLYESRDSIVPIRFESEMNRVTRDLGIFCASEEYDNLLLWSHYADHHRGVCIQIDTKADMGIANAFMKVNYSENAPTLSVFHADTYKHSIDSIGTKSKVWTYEREWRMYCKDYAGRLFPCDKSIVSKVIIGAMATKEKYHQVLRLVKDSGRAIEVKQAKIVKGSYQLEFHDVPVH